MKQEKNHKTLSDAIKGMKQHQAPADLWGRIEQKLEENSDKELNRDSLKEAIGQLPESQAPDKAWKKIERTLDGSPSRSWIAPAIGLAATVTLLFVTWLSLPALEYIAPIAETESTIEVPTAATLTAWQSSREEEEAKVFACFDSLSSTVKSDSLIMRYEDIVLSLDSLASFLQEPAPHKSTTGRFQRLELARKRTLAKLEQIGCLDTIRTAAD